MDCVRVSVLRVGLAALNGILRSSNGPVARIFSRGLARRSSVVDDQDLRGNSGDCW